MTLTAALTPANETELRAALASVERPQPQGSRLHTWPVDPPPLLLVGRGGPGGNGAVHRPRLSLRHFNRIHDIDAKSGLVLVEAGVTLGVLAAALAPHALTLEHFGPLPAGATVGGLLARRWPASPSWYRPDIQGACTGLYAMDFGGRRFEYIPAPRKSSGPDLRGFWVGAAGAHGVITAAHLAVGRVPEVKRALTVGAADAQVLLLALFEAVRAGLRPWSATLWATEAGGSLSLVLAGVGSLVEAAEQQLQNVLAARGLPRACEGEQHPALLTSDVMAIAAEDTLYAPLRLPGQALCSGSGHVEALGGALALAQQPGFAVLVSMPSPTDASAALLHLSDSDAPAISAADAKAATARWAALPWRWTPPNAATSSAPTSSDSWRARWDKAASSSHTAA
jgi:hypothetical protein